VAGVYKKHSSTGHLDGSFYLADSLGKTAVLDACWLHRYTTSSLRHDAAFLFASPFCTDCRKLFPLWGSLSDNKRMGT